MYGKFRSDWLALAGLAACSIEGLPAPSGGLDPNDAVDGCAEIDGRVVCNHGHSINLRSENLRERRLYLEALGFSGDHSMLITSDRTGALGTGMPDPITPVLRAHLGETIRLRVVSFGGEAHTFHVHGHVWLDPSGSTIDNVDLLPAESLEATFSAGGGPTPGSPERGGAGDWLYHCHVEGHVVSGMWSLLRVMGAGDPDAALETGGRFPGETPAPLGAAGETVDVWVVAVDAPLELTREFSSVTGTLRSVTRRAWLYVPVSEDDFVRGDAEAIRAQVDPVAFQPWVLSVMLGAHVRVHLKNLLTADRDVPVSLHPHGLTYGLQDDGSTLGSVAVRRGDVVDYEYQADVAGVWAYHDHAHPQVNVPRGLFAAIVVTTPEEQAALERDYVVLFTDLDANWLNGIDEPGAGHAEH